MLTREQAFAMADFAERRGFEEVELGGGEPTLLPYFWELLERLCGSGLRVLVLTNAYRLSDEDVDRFASCGPKLHIQVSIDGIGSVHDSIRGAEGAFDNAERGLRALASKGCAVSIGATVQRTNYRNLVEVYERFKDISWRYHAFNPVEQYGDNDSELIPPEEFEDCMSILSEICERGQADGKPVALSKELLENFRLKFKHPNFCMHRGQGCTVVRSSLTIDHNGTVRPCWHYGWDTEGIERNINQRTLDEIVDSPEVLDELKHAIRFGGCPGCSTMCYNWDEDFQRKAMRPAGWLKLRRKLLCSSGLLGAQRSLLRAKENLRENHPKAFALIKSVRHMKMYYDREDGKKSS